jgi:hypothetical protein
MRDEVPSAEFLVATAGRMAHGLDPGSLRQLSSVFPRKGAARNRSRGRNIEETRGVITRTTTHNEERIPCS